MNAELSPHLCDTVIRLGAGAPYALKVLAGKLADDPELGRPSDLPGVLTVTVDGDVYEDCPALVVGFIREPDLIRIQYVRPVNAAAPAAGAAPGRRQVRPAAPAADAVAARETADAWKRVTRWLQHNAADSYAALRAGANATTVNALEHGLGVQVPLVLRVLWSLTAGDDGVDGAGCLPGNQALMTPDAVAVLYRQQLDSRAHTETLNARRAEGDRIAVWQAEWIPFASHGPADRTSGLYLDSVTGYLGRWSRYDESADGELDTLVTYLEEAADMLEAPALATRDRPGLVGAALVWGSRLDPATEDRWRPLAG